MPAPVALFVYNRPSHTRQTVAALLANEGASQTDLHIFADGPRDSEQAAAVAEVRDYIRSVAGFRSVRVTEQATNLGLANSIVAGVTALCERDGRVIVLEDDLVTAPNFLTFMNAALEHYADEPRVYSVTGYSFTSGTAINDATYFLPLTSTWGWATWANKWKVFRRDRDALSRDLADRRFRREFNFEDCFDFSGMAERTLKGETDSWGIHWHYCVMKARGLVLFPAQSLVQNIGYDGSGTNTFGSNEGRMATFDPVLTDDVVVKPAIRSAVEHVLLAKNYRPVERDRLRRVVGRPGALLDVLQTFAKRRVSYPNQVRIDQWREALRLMRRRKDVGRNTFIDRSVQVLGWEYTSIGASSAIGEGTWLNVNQKVAGHKHIVIGDHCYIGRRNFISSGWQVVVRDYCMTGVDCKLVGADHVFDSPSHPYITTGVTNDKVVRLGVNVWLGVGVTVIGNVSIGHGSIVGAGALVNRDIPPFSVAVGSPCRVLRRFDFRHDRWVDADDVTGAVEAAMPDEPTYLERLKATHPSVTIPLVAASRRFGDTR